MSENADNNQPSKAETAQEISKTFDNTKGIMSDIGNIIGAHQEERTKLARQLGRELTLGEDKEALGRARARVLGGQESGSAAAKAGEPTPHRVTPPDADATALRQVRGALTTETAAKAPLQPEARIVNADGQELYWEPRQEVVLKYGDDYRGDEDKLYLITDEKGDKWQLFRTDSFAHDHIVRSLAGDGSFGRKIPVGSEGEISDAKFNQARENSSWILVNASSDITQDQSRARFIGEIHDPSMKIQVGTPFGFSASEASTPTDIKLVSPRTPK